MFTLTPAHCSPLSFKPSNYSKIKKHFKVYANGFPPFLPKDVENISDSFARKLAMRIERLPVQLTSSSETSIMSSCVRPMVQGKSDPIVLLHGFDSSCLEWRYAYPMLEEAGFECWAFDILGWGFSDLERLPDCDVASKRNHLYQFWKSYIKRPMILVGPSLGAAVAIDFAVNHPEAVSKLILIDASVYAEGTGEMAKLPRLLAYAGVALLKSVPLRLYVNLIAFNNVSFSTSLDWMKIGRLHCQFPWWEDAAVNFMISGGYNVVPLIKQVKQRTLIIWGEDDQIISYKLALRLHGELQDAIVRQIPDCGHIPHVEKPSSVADLIIKFSQLKCGTELFRV
ncbi:alpha/beta hydrolase domain-containing protein VTE7 [Amaranthus tricolor]|uniref:alpha/beta hydrolase domain-containing protein VTE7 n=1 Tax=Amaranthus tricolor TaxID=29722 RepID=UPI0025859E15|nr:alpha/beta hydrolase domain-containing protein VTE7 [Amaranthus tricolor]